MAAVIEPSREQRAPNTSLVSAWLRLLRPHQWTKNAFCLAGVVFSGRLSDKSAIVAGIATFLMFCAASSAIYIVNDVIDRDRDRLHPRKRNRPLARGIITPAQASVVAAVLAAGALTVSFWLGLAVLWCVLTYFAVNLLYNYRLKHLVLIDAGIIAFGFVLRLMAGIYAVHELPTAWITLCTLFLALFLAFAKRRTELADIGTADTADRRPVLASYTVPLLDSLVNSTATMTVLCYALFTATSGRNPTLVVTVPLVHYGMMRYELLLRRAAGTEEPEKVLLKDPGIFFCVSVWVLCYIAITYGNLHMFK